MQITPMILSNTLLQNIQNQESQISQLQQEVSTGQTFQVPSDNPIAAENALGLNNALSQIQTYTSSAQSAQGWLNQSSGVLSNMISLWDQAIQIATQAANSTNNASDLSAMAQTVSGIQKNFGQLLNTQYEGQYLFSGYQNGTAPITVASGTALVASGTTPNTVMSSTAGNALKFEINSGATVTVNLTGWESVGQTGNYFVNAYNDLGNLVTALTTGSPALQTVAQNLQNDLSNLTSAQSLVGGRLARVQNTLTQLGNASTDISQSLSNVASANMAQVTTQLAQEEDSYQAALQSGSKILSLSLLNFINP